MRSKQIQYTFFIGAIAIIGIILIQINWLFTTWEMNKEKLEQTIWIALKDIHHDLNDMYDCTYNDLDPVKNISSTCYMVDVSCEFTSQNLEYTVKTIFNKKHLNIEYELTTYNCNIGQLEYLGKFYSNDIFNDNTEMPGICYDVEFDNLVYFFIINLSGQKLYLLKQMRLWLFLSLVVIIILVFFTYTIVSFYNQKQLAELQKDFINNMTHELKTPISTIGIASNVLLEESEINKLERYSNYINIIKKENNRLNRMVENVLLAAKIEKGKNNIKTIQIKLNEFIAELFTENTLFNAQGNITIEKDLTAQNDLIYADSLHLTNIVFNLIDNSIKYNQNDVDIIISTRNTHKYIELSISDNGIGIDDKYKNKVFKKFFRVPTGDLHNVKGFGLGLFYVKQVCKNHRWIITLITEKSKGARFIIKIPNVK